VLRSDEDLTQACPVILSVVPPRDAAATAERIADALTGPSRRTEPLYFVDLNAVAPSTVREMAATMEQKMSRATAPVQFVDGCILGAPPTPPSPPIDGESGEGQEKPRWKTPSMPTSGPHSVASIPGYGERLATTLCMRHIGEDIGAASGLKMSFASLSKGFTAIAIQSFTTARRLGVLGELRRELGERMPHHLGAAERGVVGMAPKAYRWVREMEEIALAFDEDGGFATRELFRGAAETYRAVAEDTPLGREKVGGRKRGLDIEDMADAMSEGMEKRRKKND
jgi:hypothetical protein